MALDRFHENQQLEAQLLADQAVFADMQSKLDAAHIHAVALQENIDRFDRRKAALIGIAAENATRADALQNTIEESIQLHGK